MEAEAICQLWGGKTHLYPLRDSRSIRVKSLVVCPQISDLGTALSLPADGGVVTEKNADEPAV